MMRTAWLAMFAVMMSGACTQRTPEQQIVNDAAEALGGSNRVLAVRTLVIEGAGTQGNLGQDMRPDATGQAFNITDYRRSVDVAAGRARVEQTRTPNFAYFQGAAPQKQVLGLDGDVGYNVAANGNATRVANLVADDRRAEIYHHPLTSVRAALDPKAQLARVGTMDNQSAVSVTTPSGFKFTLAVDITTKLPTRVVSMGYNANLGDVATETSFANYQDVNGLRLPARITTKTDKYTTADIRVTKQAVDAEAGDLAAPAAAASAAPIAGFPPANIAVENVAKGVQLLAGQSHHSVLVEFSDHLVLIESPQNETRTAAVIAKARELHPNTPLTHVVNTHHHFDHSGGIRAAVAEGLTVITHKGNASFYEDAVGRSHTIVPDALARSPKPLKVETVDDELILKDDAMTVALYHIAGSPHADTQLMAYFPRERILVEADVYTPGGAVQPYAANLLQNIRNRNLRIDRIVPLHGKSGSFGDLVKTVQPASSN